MENRASHWHKKRREVLIKDERFVTLPGPSWTTKVSLIFVPALHVALCYVASRTNILTSIFMAYFIGSVVFMYLFSNAHEIFHGALGKVFVSHKFKNLVLRFATVTDISSAFYLYYRYGHGPHHFDQGTHNVESLHQKHISPSTDFDPLTHMKNIYKFKLPMDDEPSYRFPSIETNRLHRFFAIFVMPFFDTLRDLLVEPVKLAYWFKLKNSPFSRKALEDVFIQGLLIMGVLVTMRFLFGNWHHLFYAFFARAFFQGFLHPYGFLWASVHSSVDKDGAYQPAVSINGRVATFLCAGINLHVEHHDLPWVPRASLINVNAIKPELYRNLKQFSGLTASARHVFQKHYNNVYSP